ncbi:N-acetylmuramoyl-L-alanine amidase [Paenibacillus dakarensis]|uniref:N-acetylmuramoyl-L-alanine amidase n=1 Tax=Paenibacillus dakarensis TaxID=1527293 RepID=UPI0006D57FD2|nr:N-acetylmuramoyl-L-alanine amidase [Paenibacillus dakarensis]
MIKRILLSMLLALSFSIPGPGGLLPVYAEKSRSLMTDPLIDMKHSDIPHHNPATGSEESLELELIHPGLQRHHPFPHEMILIDVGHGGIDGGTSYQGILEKDINLAISRHLFKRLRSEGYIAVMNRDADYALSEDNRWHASRSRHRKDLAQRKQLSSEIPTKLVVSIHVNWAKNKTKRGGIVLHQAEGRSSLLAECIQRQLNGVYSSNHETTVGKPFYLLNRMEVPAVIVETGFISNLEDRILLTSEDGQKAIANAIVDGIVDYLTAL